MLLVESSGQGITSGFWWCGEQSSGHVIKVCLNVVLNSGKEGRDKLLKKILWARFSTGACEDNLLCSQLEQLIAFLWTFKIRYPGFLLKFMEQNINSDDKSIYLKGFDFINQLSKIRECVYPSNYSQLDRMRNENLLRILWPAHGEQSLLQCIDSTLNAIHEKRAQCVSDSKIEVFLKKCDQFTQLLTSLKKEINESQIELGVGGLTCC